MQLSGRVALVTGAGSGIGKSAALTLAQEGAKTACLSRTKSQVEEVAAAIQGAGGEAMPLVADISQADQMEDAVRQIVEAWGRLDIVVANAGINGVWAPLEEITAGEWDQTFAINVRGTFLTVKYALPYLKRAGGSVIVVSSVNGTRIFSNTGFTAYSCSKAAQLAFTKMTALELAPHKVRVNCICPGAVITEIIDNTVRRNLDKVRYPVEYPQGRIPLTHGQPADPEKVAQLILFLAGDASDHITGTEMWIDGGQSLLQG